MSTETARDHAAMIALIEDRMRTGFAWGKGQNDCASFAGAAVQAQTGRDPLSALPAWTNAKGAARILKRRGGLTAVVDTLLSPIPVAMAARGDVALVETATGPALMVVEGDTLVGPAVAGLMRLPRSAMLRAWSAT